MPITDKEKEVLDFFFLFWNRFEELEQLHPDDQMEFKFYLHALQNIVLSRSAYRELNQTLCNK